MLFKFNFFVYLLFTSSKRQKHNIIRMLRMYHKKYFEFNLRTPKFVDISILLASFEKNSTFRNNSDIGTIFTQIYMEVQI